MTPEDFNSLYPIGTEVNYHPIIGQPDHVKTKTRSQAWTLKNKEAVVMVEGKAGCVSLEAISIDPKVERMAELSSKMRNHGLFCECSDCKEYWAIKGLRA